MFLPPNKANIYLHKNVGYRAVQPITKTELEDYTIAAPIPTEYLWVTGIDPNLDKSEKNEYRKPIKELILKAPNQFQCGDCFLVSTCSVLSDLFLIKYGLKENPNLSPMYMLNNYFLNTCDTGGMPLDVIHAIFDHGIVSSRCVDNSVCSKDPLCKGDQDAIAKAIDQGKTENDINQENNQTIQNLGGPGSGCYTNEDGNHFLFQPSGNQNDPFIYVHPSRELDLQQAQGYDLNKYPSCCSHIIEEQDAVRTFLYRFGPVVGCFMVLKNFQTYDSIPNTSSVYEDIYFDFVDMDGTVVDPKEQDVVGGHAVAIVGYGISKNKIPVRNKDGNIVNLRVPYWWVRNSWTEQWNKKYKGCIKFAMFPFNTVSQFDIPTDATDLTPIQDLSQKSLNSAIGGFVSFQAGSVQNYTNAESNNYAKQNSNLSDKTFYDNDEPFYKAPMTLSSIVPRGVIIDKNGNMPTSSNTNPKSYKNVIIIILLILVILFGLLLWFQRKK